MQLQQRQYEDDEPITTRTRVSEKEMQEVMELYDTNIGIAGSRQSTAGTTSLGDTSELPTIGDVAEILGVSTTEAERLLEQVRAKKRAAARLRALDENTSAASRMSVSTPQAQWGQQVVVVQNIIQDSHAQNFEKFNANAGQWTPTWNWGPFFFNFLWFFYKGMWVKGLIYLFLLIASGGTAFPFLSLWLGLMGNYDYYLLRCHGTQGWDRRPVSAINPATTVYNSYNSGYRSAGATLPPRPAGTFGPRERSPQNRPLSASQDRLDTHTERLQMLRETYERGLLTQAEYNTKRLSILQDVERQADLQRLRENLEHLEEAYRHGLLTEAEYQAKRRQLLEA